jgi:hypothetical protein
VRSYHHVLFLSKAETLGSDSSDCEFRYLLACDSVLSGTMLLTRLHIGTSQMTQVFFSKILPILLVTMPRYGVLCTVLTYQIHIAESFSRSL